MLNKIRRSIRFVFIIPTLIFFLTATSCSRQGDKIYKDTRILMATAVSITVVSPTEQKAKEAIDAGFNEIKRIDDLLNLFSDKSDISLINSNAGLRPVKVSKDTIEVIEDAIEISRLTGGAFDPTVGPVKVLWNFDSKVIPPGAEIKKALPLVGYKNIEVKKDSNEVFLKKKGMMIDLGAIAKGFAADKAVQVIKAMGIKAGIVAASGDIRAFGLRPDGKLWHIGIRNPRGGRKDALATLYLSNGAISTSGDYEQFFILNGRRYCHIFDPKTGYSPTDTISASVIAPDGYKTDSLATGLFVLGHKKGIRLLEKLGLDGMIIGSDHKIYLTKTLRGKIEIKGDNQFNNGG